MLHQAPEIVSWRNAEVIAPYYFNLAAHSKGRARADFHTPIATRNWQKLIADDAYEQMDPDTKTSGRLGSRIIMRLPTQKGDIDNMLKALWDAMQTIAYANDSQFDYVELVRTMGDVPQINVELLVRL